MNTTHTGPQAQEAGDADVSRAIEVLRENLAELEEGAVIARRIRESVGLPPEDGSVAEYRDAVETIISALTTTPARVVSDSELPELPNSFGDHCVADSVRTMREPGYTAAQMREYARSAIAQERN